MSNLERARAWHDSRPNIDFDDVRLESLAALLDEAEARGFADAMRRCHAEGLAQLDRTERACYEQAQIDIAAAEARGEARGIERAADHALNRGRMLGVMRSLKATHQSDALLEFADAIRALGKGGAPGLCPDCGYLGNYRHYCPPLKRASGTGQAPNLDEEKP